LPRYTEEAPSADLAPWVACYWSIRADCSAPLPNRILPDGCVDIVVDLAGEARPFFVGAMRTAGIAAVAGRVDLFGIRFRPGRALPFVDAPLRELTDRQVDLDALWGPEAEAFRDALSSAAPHERVTCGEDVLRRRLSAPRREQELARGAVSLLRRARGGARVGDVAAALGVPERRLERIFDQCVGLSPKTLARVVRFRHAVRAIEGGTPSSWTAVALDTGYSDQAHFIREFKALAGVTPGEYALEWQRVGFVQYGDPER
jgi:AraC-like DNA-binding protein